jgi:selT/selW/selH-like putative selenoprotein
MAAATKLVLLAGAVLLGMDLVSVVVTGPPPAVVSAAAAPAPASAAAAASAANPLRLPAGLHCRLCTACSYKGYYTQLAAQLQERYSADGSVPPFQASASTYPPSLPRRAIAGVATVAQAAALAVAVAGDRVLPALGADPPPRWYEEHVKPRRTTVALAAWIAPNVARQAAEATGAFEVYWDGELLFSKLALGRFPEADELAAAIEPRRRRRVGGGGGGGDGGGGGGGGEGAAAAGRGGDGETVSRL